MQNLDPFLLVLCTLALLQIKHFVADFALQRPRHFLYKGIYGHWGGIEHALQHGVLTWAIMIYITDPRFALTMGIFDAVIHYHVDWFKTKYGPKDSTSNKFWVWFGADQLAHQLTYLVIVYFLSLII